MKQKSSLILSLSNLLSHALPRRLFMTTFALLFSCFAMAYYDVEVDGIYYYVHEDSKTATVSKNDYNTYRGVINIPSSITVNDKEYSVTTIGSRAFNGSYVTSVTIPNSVTSIEEEAFYGCSSLTSVTIGNSVTSIGRYAFNGCSSAKELVYAEGTKTALRIGLTYITSVVIPNSVTSIGSYAFEFCSRLTSITIPNSVKKISDNTFEGCLKLSSISIPSAVTSIGSYAFQDCSSLETAVMEEGVRTIGSYAFKKCSKLSSISIPSTVTSIGSYAFDDCTEVSTINYGGTIGDWCEIDFFDMYATPFGENGNATLKIGGRAIESALVIPDGVTRIGSYAFYNNKTISSVTIPSSVTFIGNYAFYSCSSLTSVNIPNLVTRIGYMTFSNCEALTNITIPNSVTIIDDYAFNGCSNLTSVTIGNSVTKLGINAFQRCSHLREIHSNNITPPECVGNTGFSGTFRGVPTANCRLYVPIGSKEDYAFSTGWGDFVNIIEELVINTSADIEKPSISYENKKLIFGCGTPDVTYSYEIKAEDNTNNLTDSENGKVNLSAAYVVTVYAKKDDKTSESATATLIWLDARLEGGTTNAKEISVPSVPLLITQDNGMVTASGLQDGQLISAYDTTGKQIATAKAIGDAALLDLSEMQGKVAILNVAGRSARVMIK